MSRTRIPTARALLTNNDKVNPARWKRQLRDMEPDPLGPLTMDPPAWMSDEQGKQYREVVSRCHKDVLCVADVVTVSMVACLTAHFIEQEGEMSIQKMRTLSTLLDKLGMSPAARSKVQAVNRAKKTKDELDEFNS